MDPYDEQRLRNEVIYLHHLWHQGPPTTPPNPNPFPKPQPCLYPYLVNPRPPHPFFPNHPTPFQPINSTSFKRKSKKKNRKPRKGSDNSNNLTRPDPPLNPCSEWPIPMSAEESAPTVSGWPPLQPRTIPAKQPLTENEKEMLEALQVQYKARQACREFLSDSDEDEDNEEEDADDDDDADDDGSDEIGGFFSKLFGENNQLRNYYEKCCEGGEFRCLVCGVYDNKNAGKRFSDCVGLVQHSMSIARTKKRRAHRAFGNAVCKVLGWDINRLPTIVVNKEVKPAEAEGDPKENAGDGKDGCESSDKSDDKVSMENFGETVKQDAKDVHEINNGVSESVSKVDLNKNAENLDEKISDTRSDKERGTDKDELEKSAVDHIDDSVILQENNGKVKSTCAGKDYDHDKKSDL